MAKPQTISWHGAPYPDLISGLPEINVGLAGVRGWLLQGGRTQAVFFVIEPVGEIPPHNHCAQWGIVVDGEMKLTIGGEAKLRRKGDSYYIPEGVTHSAIFLTRVHVIDVFDSPDRYQTK